MDSVKIGFKIERLINVTMKMVLFMLTDATVLTLQIEGKIKLCQVWIESRLFESNEPKITNEKQLISMWNPNIVSKRA